MQNLKFSALAGAYDCTRALKILPLPEMVLLYNHSKKELAFSRFFKLFTLMLILYLVSVTSFYIYR